MADNGIVILNRSDVDHSMPRIIIRARNDHQNSKLIEEIRMHLLERRSPFTVTVSADEANGYTLNRDELPFYLINRACSYRKPFVDHDFDYLRRSVRRTSTSMRYNAVSYTITYTIQYLTTLQEEQEIDRRLHRLFLDRNVYGMNDPLDKIKFAYDHIISTVRYDDTLERHSAYHALVEQNAVCEGCALLLYRMLSMASIPCRIIRGMGHSSYHAWNLIKLNGLWYNADVTWDLSRSPLERSLFQYRYFLKSDAEFPNHTRDDEFSSPAFRAQHTMSARSYAHPRVSRISLR